jgi:epoxyqueuosine reductase
MPESADLTAMVKGMATRAGFARVGIAPGEPLPGRPAEAYRAFLRQGLHAGMGYLQRNIDKRFAPRELYAEVRSVICLAVSYAPAGPLPQAMPFVARYARGRDYHHLLRDRCRALIDEIRREVPDFAGRVFVDAGPIAERSLAARAGLGWVGRNGCLIVPGLGSYVVLAEILCNLPLAAEGPLPASCGDCTA